MSKLTGLLLLLSILLLAGCGNTGATTDELREASLRAEWMD